MKKNIRLFRTLIPGLLALCLTGKVAAQLTNYPFEEWKSWDYAAITQDRSHTTTNGQDSVPYRLFLPDNFSETNQYPLVLVLHGNGSRGTDNYTHLIDQIAGWMQPALQNEFPCILILPQMNTDWAPGPFSGNTFYETSAITYMRAVQDLMARFYEKDFVDRSRIYVYGTSKGGAGTWDFTMRNTDIVAAAMPMMGWGDPSEGARLVDVPIWANHGTQDTIVPTTSSCNLIDAIATAAGDTNGVPVDPNPSGVTGLPEERLNYFFNNGVTRLSLYPQLGHSSAAYSWQDAEMINWTFAQTNAVTRPVSANIAPVWNSNPVVPVDAVLEQDYSMDLLDHVTDADNDPLFFSSTNAPVWVTLKPTGKITGRPSFGDLGLNSFTVDVSDGRGGNASVPLNITVVVDTFPPTAPANLLAVPGNANVGLVWDANSEPDFGTYNLYRATSSNSISTASDTPLETGISVLTYGDNAVTNGTTYYYAITAVDTNGNESAASAEVSATPDVHAGATGPISIYEPFDYATGYLSATPPAESGLSGSWSGISGGLDVSSGSLTAPSDYGFTTVGHSAYSTDDNYATARIGLASTNYIDFNANRVFYISYLYRQNNPVHGRMVLLSDSTQVVSIGKQNLSSMLKLALGAGSGTGSTLPNDTDMLIVARIETRTAGNDTLQASFFTSTIGGEPVTWDAEVNAEITDTVDTLELYTSTGSGIYAQFDEIRFGPTFESVTQGGSSAPAAPTGITAIPGDSVVSVSWDAHSESDLDSYTVYRSTNSGSYGSALVSGLTETNHFDDTAANGTRYFYVVTAVDTNGYESDVSAEVSAIPASFLNHPPEFTTNRIAAMDATGNIAYTASIADQANDPDGDTMYFSKTAGPDWLNVADNGVLTGTPGFSDRGTNTFTVQVISAGGSDTATLQIIVDSDTTPADETFEDSLAGSGTPPDGWTLVTTAGSPTYSTSAAGAGSDGSGGSVGLAGQVASTDYTDSDLPGGFLMNSSVFSMSSEVRIEFDFLLIHEGAYDDVTFTIGDIADGLGRSSAGELLSAKLAEQASSGVAASLNSGLGSSGRLDTTGTLLTDDTWYHAIFTWTPTSGTTGNASFTVNNFSSDLYTLSTTGFTFDSDSAQIGFGSVNDSIRFDNVQMNFASGDDTIPPAAPTGLGAAPGDGSVSLDWNDNSEGDFASYSVYRSTTSSHYSTALASGLSTSAYVDSTVANGTTYYYVVTATDTNSNESAQSSEVSAAPAGTQPSGDGAIHVYDFDGATPLTDKVGNANLTQRGTVAYTNDGTHSYAIFSAAGNLVYDETSKLVDSNPYTISMWIRGTNQAMGDACAVDGNTNFDVELDGGNRTDSGRNENKAYFGDLTDNVWNLLTITVVSNAEMNVWLNANTVVNKTGASFATGITDFLLGNGRYGFADDTGNFTGDIGLVKIYDEVWSTEQQATEYAKGGPLPYSSPSLNGYDLWVTGWGTNDIGAATNDFDNDGLNNLYEYAMDGNPTNGLAPTNLPVFTRFGNGFIYVHPKRSDDTNLIYTVETTTNLLDSGSWTNQGYTVTGTNVTGGTLDFVTNDVGTVANEKFFRLKVQQ